jgi:type I restriction enzyme S subunit
MEATLNTTEIERYPAYKDSGVEWLGEVPEHWEAKRTKFIISYQKGKNPKEIKLEETEYIYLAMDYLRTHQQKIQYVENIKDLVLVEDNDILLLWDGSNAGEFVKGKKGVLSSTMANISINGARKDFSWYFLKIIEVQLRKSTIGMGIPHVSGDELKNLLFLLPPLPEQTAIANFLDRKTAQVDTAIRIKERQIELLKERRQILIHKAVTRGLHWDSSDDRMTGLENPIIQSSQKSQFRHSGVDWIGEIPAHWEVKRAKYLFDEIDERSKTGDEELLSVSHLTGVTPRSEKNVSMFLAEDYSGSKLCRSGDLIYNIMWAWMGALGVSERVGIISPSYAVYRQKAPNTFNTWFLEQLLKDVNYVAHYNQVSTGLHSSRLRFYSNMFFEMSIGYPPKEEQDRITDFLIKSANKIDKGISLKQKEIEKLKEYKGTLINSAVTGKIKVS